MCGNNRCGTTLALPKLGYFEPVRICNICENGVGRLSRMKGVLPERACSTMNIIMNGKPRYLTPEVKASYYTTKNTKSHIESRTTRFESSETLQALERKFNFE